MVSTPSRILERIPPSMHHPSRLRLVVPCGMLAVASVAAMAQVPAAPTCVVDTLSTEFPAAWLGTRVGALTVVSGDVDTPSERLTAIARRLHRSTRFDVVSSELSFRPGQTVDSLQILESLRRLRATSLFTDVVLEGRRCGDPSQTDFAIRTRDAWSTRAAIQLSAGGRSLLSIRETNLLGSGRTLSAGFEETYGRRALSFGLADPYLLGTPIHSAVLLRSYVDGRGWQWSLQSHERSPRDTWRFALTSAQLRRFGTDIARNTETDITRRNTAFTVSRRIADGADAAYAIVVGAEQELTNVQVAQPGLVLGAKAARRKFAAPLAGLSRRSTRFRSVDWLVPNQAPAEIPIGLEGEIVGSVGQESFTRNPLAHWDAWIGGTALLSSGVVFTADIWSSGYRTRDSLSNVAVRASTALVARAWRGLWLVRATAERILDPDPDVYALSTIDPMLRTLSPASRLAERALAVSAERAIALYSSEGRWALEGAAFASWSERGRTLDATGTPTRNLQAAVVGIGLRQVSSQPTRAPLRLDIGRTVMRSNGLPNRWIVSLTATPWISAGRTRDGLRAAVR